MHQGLIMKIHRLLAAGFLGVIACDSTGSMAQLARSAVVAGCKPLGETTLAADGNSSKSRDERIAELRQRAAQLGATHIVSEGSNGAGSMKGQMYMCTDTSTQPDTETMSGRLGS